MVPWVGPGRASTSTATWLLPYWLCNRSNSPTFTVTTNIASGDRAGVSYLNDRATVLVALLSFVLLYSIVTYSGWLQGVELLWWSDMAWTIRSLAAGLKCLHTARLQKRRNRRQAWLAFGVAALLWFTGMLVWDYLELVRSVVTPYPSLADYFYIALAPAFVLGILLYREDTSTRYVTLVQGEGAMR